MPFALLIIGAFLLIAAVRGTASGPNGLFALVAGDFTTQPSFIYWAVAILVIGAFGYIPKVKPIATAMLGLLVVVLFLKKGDPTGIGGGFFQQFTAGLATTTQPAAAPAATAATAPITGSMAGLGVPAPQVGTNGEPLTGSGAAGTIPLLSLPTLTNLVQ